MFGLGGMSHRCLSVDQVVVAAADAAAVDDFRLDEVCDDPLGCPFGDPDPFGDVPESDVDVVGDAEKDLCVVREERPRRRVLILDIRFLFRISFFASRVAYLLCRALRFGD
jgi:hypothetical protein